MAPDQVAADHRGEMCRCLSVCHPACYQGVMRLALIASLCVCGCMSVPMRYRAAQRTYQSRIEQLSVVGFERTEYRTTGSASSTVIAPQLGLYGVGVGETGEYHQAS